MDIIEIIIILIIAIGIVFCLHIVLRDPLLMLKTLLRALKGNEMTRITISFIPIWGPVWIIDKIFKLNIFINDFEDASKPKKIKFSDFEKYIQIDTDDSNYIEETIRSFRDVYDPKDYNYTLDGATIKLSQHKNSTTIKIENGIDFDCFNVLIQYIYNSAPQDRIFNVRGILINSRNKADSYFCYVDIAYPMKLVGKTYRNKKIYVNYSPDKKNRETIYFNSNIDYFRNFRFNKFITELTRLKFKDIE